VDGGRGVERSIDEEEIDAEGSQDAEPLEIVEVLHPQPDRLDQERIEPLRRVVQLVAPAPKHAGERIELGIGPALEPAHVGIGIAALVESAGPKDVIECTVGENRTSREVGQERRWRLIEARFVGGQRRPQEKELRSHVQEQKRRASRAWPPAGQKQAQDRPNARQKREQREPREAQALALDEGQGELLWNEAAQRLARGSGENSEEEPEPCEYHHETKEDPTETPAVLRFAQALEADTEEQAHAHCNEQPGLDRIAQEPGTGEVVEPGCERVEAPEGEKKADADEAPADPAGGRGRTAGDRDPCQDE